MRMTKLLGKRLKERPADAIIESHALLLRGAYIRQVSRGIYSLYHPARRITHKIEAIIREEMDRIGGQEVLMPVVMPQELWVESGRYDSVGPELVRFKDRTEHGLVLGMTHEEAVVHLFRDVVESYRQLPFMAYQIQTKFRDEARPRAGLIRVREFTMKDAYSFHTSQEDLDSYYEQCRIAYRRIFARAGIPETAVVQSDTGMMGGSVAHEFMLLCDAGEDTIVSCSECGYLANLDVATGSIEHFPAEAGPLTKVHTPNQRSIEDVAAFLNVPTRQLAKCVFYDRDEAGKPVLAMIRGDIEVSEAKLAKVIRAQPIPADDQRIRAVGCEPGYASILGLPQDSCRVVVDHSVAESGNLVCGANEPNYHHTGFNLFRECPGVQTQDIAQVREGDGCPSCGAGLQLRRGIEVGNIFQLGRKYTEALGMTYLDEDCKVQIPIMGSYGIGVGRLLASVVEARRDERGPIWPVSIAPWQVHIVTLKINDTSVAKAAEEVYQLLQATGIEVIWDDRKESPGVQFADADLLGVPFRIVVSPKSLGAGGAELLMRGEKRGEVFSLDEIGEVVQQKLERAREPIWAEVERVSEPC